jgi:hypothetical protein
MTARVLHGDCIAVMQAMDDACVDAIVTDPPAGISFMGKGWDGDKGGRDQWVAWMQSVAVEALRVAKPGAHALVWALPRTSHWTATGWENAGWTVKDRVSHMFGTGFPKGLNVVNQLIKLALWQSPNHVLRAAQSSGSIQVRSEKAKAPIAVALVQILPVGDLALITEIGGEVALHVPTDTWPSEWMATIGLNMTWSWNGSLDDACDGVSKCITSTASKTITDQRTFDWLTGLHTSGTTTRCNVILQNGSPWPALTAATCSSDALTSKPDIQLVSALGNVTWQPLGRFAGFNVALKPAMEDWWLLRKPLIGTVAANVLAHGTGAINIGATRVDGKRWPANLLHDGSDEVLEAFAAFGTRSGFGGSHGGSDSGMWAGKKRAPIARHNDSGTAARYFMTCGYSEEEARQRQYAAQGSSMYNDGPTEGLSCNETANNAGNSSTQDQATLPEVTGGFAQDSAGTNTTPSPRESGQHPAPTTRDTTDGPDSGAKRAAVAHTSSLSTDGFGSESTDLSRLDTISTTSTTTAQTTGSKTSNLSAVTSTTPTISDFGNGTGQSQTDLFPDAANGAEPGSPLLSSVFEVPGPITDTASHASETTSLNGGKRTGITGTSTTEGIAQSRFFYAAKASKTDRAGSTHPCIKPVSLMRYLVKLVTPPGGTILDMFAGSGTTLLAAQLEGFHAVGIEQDAAYVADARRRLGLTFELEAAD